MSGLVEESLKVQKTREKLRKRWLAIDEGFTSRALKRTSSEIQRWIARHASDRISLKSKSVSLFDGNQNPAGLSQRVSVVVKVLQGSKPLL